MTIDWRAAKKESGGIGKEFDRPIDDHIDITIVVDELPTTPASIPRTN